MKIPVRNVYYLLLYAWGHFRSGATREVGAEEGPDLPNLLAGVLNDSTHRLLRRGLDRGYVGVTEETRSPRGKLRLDVMSKQQTLLRGCAVCDFDELTPDVIHNQVLKASLLSLADCSDVAKELRHSLRATAMRMIGVSSIRLTTDVFRRVQLSRNTSQYGLAMRVSELVFYALMPSEEGRGSKFSNLLDDETRMSAIFEDFLRNFYRSELSGYTATGEVMHWWAQAAAEADLDLLPVMKTDITLRSSKRTMVVDAKYYREVLSGGRYDHRVRSPHLYQLMTYLSHVRTREPKMEVSGLLVYPAGGSSLRLRYELLGIPVTVATVDLSADWKDIHTELLNLISL